MEMVMVDDDGRKRTGTVWTATAHTITAVIGSGVLSLPWSVAQMGWVIGPLVLFFFAYVTYYTSNLLCDCYRTPDPVKGKRNHSYMEAVKSCLGPKDVFLCAFTQYSMIWGMMIGYTIVVSTSMMSVDRSNCLHKKGDNADCGVSGSVSGNIYMIIFGVVQIVLSQFPNLEKVTVISIVAAVMSFAYSFIGVALCISKLASQRVVRGTPLGVEVGGIGGVSALTKVWSSFQALGNIAFAYTYSTILLEIQDTLKSPNETQKMKKASSYGIGVTAIFYILLGCIGYAAFGNDAPGNILTGFDEPFWLVDIANVAVLIHLVGGYQVYAQPLYAQYEEWLGKKWPDSAFVHKSYKISVPLSKSRSFKFTLCKLLLRTLFVVLTTFISMALPFFNALVGLVGSIAFWPLTVYFPVTIYLSQANIKCGERKWLLLQALSMVSLLVSVFAAVGSVVDIAQRLKHVAFFKPEL